MKLRIKSWDKYNPKRDQNSYTWFRCSNDLFSGSDFSEYDTTELAIFISIISEASKKNCDTIDLKAGFLARCGRCEVHRVHETIEKLILDGYLIFVDAIVAVASAVAVAPEIESENPPITTPTNERTNVTNERTNVTPEPVAEVIKPEAIRDLFDEKVAGRGSVLKCPGHFFPPILMGDFKNITGFPEFQKMETWHKLFDMAGKSKFLTTELNVTLSWLLKADNAYKVLAGQYQNKGSDKKLATSPVVKYDDDYTPKPIDPNAKFKLELTDGKL